MWLGVQVRGRRGGGLGRQPGQAVVEMAFVVMLLLMLAMGIVDFGVLMYRYVQSANCVREAARVVAVRQEWPPADGDDYCFDGSLQDAVVIAPADYETKATGEPVTASLEVDYDWMVINSFVPLLGESYQISASETMRLEGQPMNPPS